MKSKNWTKKGLLSFQKSRTNQGKCSKYAQDGFIKKLRKQFRDTQGVPFMLDKSRKPHFPQLETKKKKIRFFFQKMSHSANDCKRVTLWDLSTYILLQNIKKTRKVDPLVQSKNFRKKIS